MCPLCGMNLLPEKEPHIPDLKAVHGHTSLDKHEGHDVDEFARKFLVCLVLTIPVLLYSPLPATFLGWQAPQFPGLAALPLVLGSIVFWYGGWVFLRSAKREISARQPGMMTLIALAIIAAYLYSLYQILRGETDTLFWELTTLITIMLLGHWLEMRAVRGAQGALSELSKLLPDTVEVIRAGSTTILPLAQLKVGDIFMVRPGGKIAADGQVADGQSDVNESLATGESMPVKKTLESQVIAGTINGDGALQVRVTSIGKDTFLAGVMRLVAEAQSSKSKLQLLSDRAAFDLTIVAIISGVVTFVIWFFVQGDLNIALERLVAVLVVACPHALGLAIPLVASISTTLAARQGFLIRERSALEAARNVDMVVFDKTGTLTTGTYGVEGVYPAPGVATHDILQWAASVDAKSEHVVSRAIVTKAKEEGLLLSEVYEFSRLPGKGVEGQVQGQMVMVGGHSLLEALSATVPAELGLSIKAAQDAGKTISFVFRGGTLKGMIVLGDVLREESREAVAQLHKLGVAVAMITGDAEAVAAWVAKELGIKTFFAEALPAEKTQRVKELQSIGKRVAFVGDGINDAPALTQADVGIAIGAGTNVAIESAGIILMRNDPRDIANIIELSRRTYRKMIQNLFWATGYNVVALPLAAGAAASWGVILNPALSAVFMSLSTVIVAVNAVMLRGMKFKN